MPTKLQINGKLKFYSKPYGRQWKWRYQVHGRIIEPKLSVPPSLANVKIIDPLHPETVPKPTMPKWQPERRHPILESFFPKLTIKDHPNYNASPIKVASKSVRFHAGIDQVCLLTKTKPVAGLPDSILNALLDSNLTDENVMVKKYIKQALAFNPTREPCRGFKPITEPKFNIATEYGTPPHRQMQILADNLIRLCEVNTLRRFADAALTRRTVENVPISTIYQRGKNLANSK